MRMYRHLHQRTDELRGHAAADVVIIHRVAVVLLAAVLGVVVLRVDIQFRVFRIAKWKIFKWDNIFFRKDKDKDVLQFILVTVIYIKSKYPPTIQKINYTLVHTFYTNLPRKLFLRLMLTKLTEFSEYFCYSFLCAIFLGYSRVVAYSEYSHEVWPRDKLWNNF